MKISAVLILLIAAASLGVLVLVASCSINRQAHKKNDQERSKASGNSPLRHFLAEDLAEIKGRVARVYATESGGGAVVWNVKSNSSFHSSSDFGAKELDAESWDVISQLLVEYLGNISRNEIGAQLPSHYIYIVEEFCQIRLEVFRIRDTDSSYTRENDLIYKLIEATGGDEGMNWAQLRK